MEQTSARRGTKYDTVPDRTGMYIYILKKNSKKEQVKGKCEMGREESALAREDEWRTKQESNCLTNWSLCLQLLFSRLNGQRNKGTRNSWRTLGEEPRRSIKKNK